MVCHQCPIGRRPDLHSEGTVSAPNGSNAGNIYDHSGCEGLAHTTYMVHPSQLEIIMTIQAPMVAPRMVPRLGPASRIFGRGLHLINTIRALNVDVAQT